MLSVGFWSARRWWVKHFRTRVDTGLYNAYAGQIVVLRRGGVGRPEHDPRALLTTDEWDRLGGWDGVMRWGWKVERPDWWDIGATSGVTDGTIEAARARLDDWQDESYARHLRDRDAR